jgi:putative redox protein
MAQVTVTWLQNLQFVGTDSTKHSVVLSGTGPEDGIGMKPSELLLISLGACTAYDVVNILRKKREKLQDVRLIVDGEQDTEAPWAFRKIHLHYEVSGRGLAPEAVEQAIKLSEEKYCSVAATLRAGVEITFDYEVIDTAD